MSNSELSKYKIPSSLGFVSLMREMLIIGKKQVDAAHNLFDYAIFIFYR